MRSTRILETSVLGAILMATAVLAPACGSDGGSAGGAGTSGSSGGKSGASSGAGASGGSAGSTGGSGGSSGGSNGSGGSTGGSDGGGGSSGGSDGSGGSTGGAGGGGNCGTSFEVTYGITGQLAITDTLLNLGNATREIGPGELRIRFAVGSAGPAPGSVWLLSYTMTQKFTIDTSGLSVTTDVAAKSGPDDCGIARGTLTGTSLGWAACGYGANHGTLDWTPDDGASGAGCISGFNVKGNINCNDQSALASCSQGNLVDGDNPKDDTWDQPLNTFVFSADYTSFTMRGVGGPAGSDDKGVETPDRSQSRTWFNLNGTEKSRQELETPACACP